LSFAMCKVFSTLTPSKFLRSLMQNKVSLENQAGQTLPN
jgi:hypothetical protein